MDQRVPKKLLLENGAPTAADKRHINDGIEELHLAGGAQAHDHRRARVSRRRARVSGNRRAAASPCAGGQDDSRLAELIHRAIPYPVLLIVEARRDVLASPLAHKRWSQGEAGKTVLDGAAEVRRRST